VSALVALGHLCSRTGSTFGCCVLTRSCGYHYRRLCSRAHDSRREQDICRLFVERNARASTIVSSNRDTAEWIAAFGDALVAQSPSIDFKNNARLYPFGESRS